MTTKSPVFPPGAYIPKWVDPDTFISPDPPPMPDAMHQEPHFTDLMSTLRRHLRGQPNWDSTLISGDSHFYYDRDNLNNRYEPDCHVAFNVDVAAIWPRNGYMTWVAGKPPDFALEIASESTGQRDTGIKRQDYARIGIREYWRFDPTGGDLHDAPLAGDRLSDGRYEPIPTHTEPDGSIWGYSAVLDLWLCWDSGWLLLWDPKTRRFLRNIDAADDDRQAAEDALAATQDALAATQETLESERSARQSTAGELETAQETIRQLREQLGQSEPE
jgi:hypothetical protein